MKKINAYSISENRFSSTFVSFDTQLLVNTEDVI